MAIMARAVVGLNCRDIRTSFFPLFLDLGMFINEIFSRNWCLSRQFIIELHLSWTFIKVGYASKRLWGVGNRDSLNVSVKLNCWIVTWNDNFQMFIFFYTILCLQIILVVSNYQLILYQSSFVLRLPLFVISEIWKASNKSVFHIIPHVPLWLFKISFIWTCFSYPN